MRPLSHERIDHSLQRLIGYVMRSGISSPNLIRPFDKRTSALLVTGGPFD